MRKNILLFVLFTFVSYYVHGQGYGIKVGFNTSSIKFDPKLEMRSNLSFGFQIGLLYEMILNEELSLHSGLLFSQKGTSFVLEEKGYQFTAKYCEKIMLNYVEIPLQVLHKKQFNGMNLAVGGGTYIGFMVNAKAFYSARGYNILLIESESIGVGEGEDQLHKIDVGGKLVVELQIEKLSYGLEYGLGLLDLDNSSLGKMNNKSFGFSVSYFFNRKT